MILSFLRSRKRKKLAQQPFPSGWEPIVAKKLKFATKYHAAEREAFLTHLKVFAWEKHWVGARGLAVTDEMRVVIAGQAARIAHNLDLDAYDRLSEIVIYPSHYVHPERDAIIYGEANRWGTVVLSWDAVTHGIVNPSDGHDTAIHEFAHVLDIADGWFDGTPLLHDGKDYHAWSVVLGQHYAALKRNPRRSVLRAYGATNEAEFFAVATEAFFERPKTMKKKTPDLYRELKRFYRTDPAAISSR